MNFRPLTDTYSVSPQLFVADVETAAQQGFRAIVCARPDGEEAGQPSAEDIERAAVAAGLTFETIPVPSGLLPDAAAIERMKIVLKGVDGPVLGYCRSGMRAAHLWALAQAGARPEEEILDIGRKAGLNLSPLSERLKQAAGSADISRVPGRRFDVVGSVAARPACPSRRVC